MSQITGDVLYKAVTSNNVPFASQLIMELKAHVKRDLVNLSYVPRFFDALLIAYKVPTLAINAFSTICHLVKRVSIQDSNVLKLVDFQVVPFLIDRLADEKLSIKNTSKKAMINYWQSVPDEFEVNLKTYGLTHAVPLIRNEILTMLYEIVENNPGFGFKIFLPSIVQLMNDTDLQVLTNATELLRLFFRDVNPNNRSAKLDLVNELISQRVAKTLVNRLLIEIGDNELIQQYNNTINQSAFVTAGSTKITTTAAAPILSSQSRPRSRMSNVHRLPAPEKRRVSSSEFLRVNTPSPSPVNSSNRASFDSSATFATNSEEISNILDTIPLYNTFEDLNPVNFTDESQLLERFETMGAPFEGKETEHNWMHRERYVIQLRSILRGNAVTEYPTVLSQSIKLMKESICKAVSSLRTTLSNNGCQLCRELGIYTGQYLDGITVETLLSALVKLSASRKKISHQNANVGVVGLLLHTNFGSRTMNHLVNASHDKNAQPRIYAATWIHLTLLRHKNHKQSLENSLENITKIISKGLVDPTPAVKEKIRSAYWCFYQLFPDIANAMKNKLDTTSLRALDRCKPASVSAPSSEAPSRLSGRQQSRQSMKELIMAKKRDHQTSTQQSKSSVDEVFQRVSSVTSDHPRPRVSSESRSRVASESRSRAAKSASRVSSISRKSSFGSNPSLHRRPSTSEFRRAHSTSPQMERIARYDNKELEKEREKENENEITEVTMGTDTLKMISNLPSAVNDEDERLNDEIDEYTERIKKQSHLYELLCSEDKHAQQTGFNMIVNNHSEILSVKFNSVLDKLSISHPSIFTPMFTNNDLLKYLINYLSTDNLIRLTCLYSVEQTIEPEIISLIISEVASSDICLSIINVLNLTIDTSRLDDLNLSMQFTKYKNEIMKCCFALTSTLFTSSSRVEVFLLGTIDEVLLKCAHVIELGDDLLSVLQESYKKDSEIFKIHLFGLENRTIQTDLAEKLNIVLSETQSEPPEYVTEPSSGGIDLDQLPDLLESDTDVMDFGGVNVDGMTMVVPKAQNAMKQMPKLNSDMTMIMPKFNNKSRSSNSLVTMGQIQEEEEDVQEQDENENPFVEPKSDDFKMTTADLFREQIDNEKQETQKLQSPILLPLNSNDDAMDVDSSLQHNHSLAQTTIDHDHDRLMSDSTPDMNQLSLSDSHNRILPDIPDRTISNPPSPPKTSREIEEIIESADPLSALTKSPERIQIYEDSPTTIDTLLGFEAYIYRDHQIPDYVNPSKLLENLNNSTITNVELIYLMKSLECQRIDIDDVKAALLKYLTIDLDKDHIQIGIIILHTCILSSKLKDASVFNKLIELGSTVKNNEEELYFAIEESLELLDSVSLCVNKISTTKTLTHVQNELLLETIFSISTADNLTSEDIFNLDLTLFRLIKSRSTSVRKLSILIYAKLLKYKNDQLKDSNGDELVDDLVFKRLEGDKMKLVEYYLNRV